MKKIYLVGTLISFSMLGCIAFFGETKVSNAQVSDNEYQKLLERDKNVPQKKIDKAFAEAKKIQDEIIDLMKKEKPKFKLKAKRSNHIIAHPPGKRGMTFDEIEWQNKKTNIHIVIYLKLSKEGISKDFWHGLNLISMGAFFKVSDIGDEAILVKNVYANHKMTSVSLHFIKGRANVKVSLRNHKRKTEKNEKVLMETVRLIEPLIIARDNFDDE